MISAKRAGIGVGSCIVQVQGAAEPDAAAFAAAAAEPRRVRSAGGPSPDAAAVAAAPLRARPGVYMNIWSLGPSRIVRISYFFLA